MGWDGIDRVHVARWAPSVRYLPAHPPDRRTKDINESLWGEIWKTRTGLGASLSGNERRG